MADLIGQKLDRYTITALLGEGGMASVYRARQETVDRDVAIKVIESRLAQNPDFLKRFEREARTIGALSHPHILKLFDFGRQGDLLYLVTELLTGGSLADRIRTAPLSLDEARRVLDPVASALDFAHGRGVIHRDLKPQNVLFDATNNPYLTDFGVVKLLDEFTVLTQGGTAMGTPAYMAPEQWQGGELDSRTDVYALGVMLFEMLSGRLPFQGDTPFSMMNMHVYAPPPPLRVYRADLPSSVEKVINKALAKGREHRFQSAGEMARAFSSAMTGKTPPGLEVPVMPTEEDGGVLSGVSGPIDMTGPRRTPPSMQLPTGEDELPPPRRGRPGLFILGAVALVTIVGLIALLVASPAGDAAPTATPQVAAVPSESPDAVATILSGETPTATPRETPTSTTTATRTASLTPSQTTTATEMASTTPTLTATLLDARLAALETLNAVASLTATSWTATPTPDLLGTINAELTAIIQETQLAGETATSIIVASYTKVPTAAATATSTATPTDTLTPTTTTTPERVTANTDWTAVMQSFDGVDMVLVPVGCFQMGSTDEQVEAAFQQCVEDQGSLMCGRSMYAPERPAHQVCFDRSFWIDRTEVSNHQFAQLGGVAVNESGWAYPERPREQITWFEARDYCAQRGARLPTEAEWEYAARGPDSLIYPWGNDFDAERVIFAGSSEGGSWSVGAQPDGASWVGALDMSGNVWEWTSSRSEPYPYDQDDGREAETGTQTDVSRVLRGGSWDLGQVSQRTSVREGDAPYYLSTSVGFRCARSGEVPEQSVDQDSVHALSDAPVREFTHSGRVPANAASALVGYRVNTECDCLGFADFVLHEIRYTEANTPNNLVHDPMFAAGLPDWGIWGDARYVLGSSDLSGGQMLHVTAERAQLGGLNSAVFPVTAGANYTVTFVARVSSSTTEAGYFTIIFVPESGDEILREQIPIVPNE